MTSMPEIVSALPAEALKPENPWSQMILEQDDKFFLLHFIMGTYFGPDLKGQENPKSALQRKAENLPPYSSDQLAGSHIKRVELERVYFYVLRNADPSLAVKRQSLHQFVEGKCEDFNDNYVQFTDLFPPNLHQHFRIKNHFRVIKNIVFINNPDTHYMRKDEIELFKRLTGLQSFLLSRNAALLHTPVAVSDTNDNVSVNEVETSEEPKSLEPVNQAADFAASVSGTHASNVDPHGKVSRGLIFLPSYPTNQEWANITAAAKSGFALTGTPATGIVGPLVGLMDIGECEDAYLFRVSLPGVKRDEREFSCEVEDNGKVLIRGVTTTGERRVYRYSQVFEMQTRNLCPPGHFSVSFQLPGPVDPQQFAGSFGTDGILEGIVMKKLQKQPG